MDTKLLGGNRRRAPVVRLGTYAGVQRCAKYFRRR